MSGARVPTELEHLVEWLDTLAPRAKGAGTAAAAEAVRGVVQAQYRAGRGPTVVWPPRKADGAPALQRPALAIVWTGKRGAIRAQGEDVLEHHRRRRPVYPPQNTLTPEMAAAAEAALRKVLEEGAPRT